jgi:hypothetical protein
MFLNINKMSLLGFCVLPVWIFFYKNPVWMNIHKNLCTRLYEIHRILCEIHAILWDRITKGSACCLVSKFNISDDERSRMRWHATMHLNSPRFGNFCLPTSLDFILEIWFLSLVFVPQNLFTGFIVKLFFNSDCEIFVSSLALVLSQESLL